MVKRCAKTTPDNFRFTAKFPRDITHENRLGNLDKLPYFFQAMAPF
jgi:uncharacterized protein YecE (DUF72 family)